MSEAQEALHLVESLTVVPRVGSYSGPGFRHPGNGNHVLHIQGPSTGARDPGIFLTYNGRATSEAGKFGRGWSDANEPSVLEVDTDTAGVIHGDGSITLQENKDGNGDYDSSGANSLQKVGGTWVETTPKKWKLYYDSSGTFTRMKNPAGAIWTMIRSGSDLSAVRSPDDRRMTYLFDGGGNSRAVQLADNRRVSFTVDGGDLTKVVFPDGSRITMSYSGHGMKTCTVGKVQAARSPWNRWLRTFRSF